jgi:hypothetical protein
MQRSNSSGVWLAVLLLTLQVGCDGSPPATGPDDPSQQADGGTPPEGETLNQRRARWRTEREGKAVGVAASFDVSGSPLHLTASGQAQVDTPTAMKVGPSSQPSRRIVFFANAQVGAQTGLLLLEGERLQVTGGTLAGVGIQEATSRTHTADGGTSALVELRTQRNSALSKPQVTFPEDWPEADSALFFADAFNAQPANLTLTGFTRGLLLTAQGNLAITSSVTVTSASWMAWDSASRLEAQSATVQSARLAFGGAIEGGTLASAELTPAPPRPVVIKGVEARTTLRPGSATSEGSFRLTQAVSEQGLLLPAELEIAYDSRPVTVKRDGRGLVPVIFRERTLRGDAVLADVQVTGSGKDAVRVPVEQVDTFLGRLWTQVGETGYAAPVFAIPLAILTPWIAIGEWLSCLFSDCPEAYPLWMEAGAVSRFTVVIDGAKLPPGSYEAQVTLTGRNHPAFTVPVRFTIAP